MEIKCPAGTFAVPDEFTLREMRSIKTLTGLLPGQIEEALDQGDLDIVLALVIISAARAGKKVTEETVLDWTLSEIDFVEEPATPKKKVEDPTPA
jgi:hypothetical protein